MAFCATGSGRRISVAMRESCRENTRGCPRMSLKSWETTALITDIRFNTQKRRYRDLELVNNRYMTAMMEKYGICGMISGLSRLLN